MSNYYDGVNRYLLGSLPHAASQVLELGCANGRLGEAYKEVNPHCTWTGIEFITSCIKNAITRLDHVVWMNLNTPNTKDLQIGVYDTIVLGDIIEHLVDPESCLQFVHSISREDAVICLSVPNMTHYSIYHRMLLGDLTYDEQGIMDQTHLRWLSSSSIIKMLLNTGWMPTVQGIVYACPDNEKDQQLFNSIMNVGIGMGLNCQTLERNLTSLQYIITATKAPTPKSKINKPLTVIVPVNNKIQFNLNVDKSPGLKEITAEIIPVVGASTAAEALSQGSKYASNDWILFCHQDVFIPRNSGYMINEVISQIPVQHIHDTLIGFAGLSNGNPRGLVIDRITAWDHPSSRTATGLDEFAILLTKNSKHQIDSNFGWHCWATDLCLVAEKNNLPVNIVRVPMFHNSQTTNVLSDSFTSSCEQLKHKHKGYGTIVATTGTFVL